MADSLRDQLLKSGLVQKLKAEAKPAPAPQGRGGPPSRGGHKPGTRGPASAKSEARKGGQAPRSREEIDLARAYALRDRAERDARDQEKRAAEQRAKDKAERKHKLAALLEGKALNDKDADVARHFSHGDKIRRVYCTPAQLVEVNTGQLAVVQHLGRYLLVTPAVAAEVRAISAEAFILQCDPDAAVEDDIPPDLTW
jgi:uncharacterized protein